MFTNNRRLNNRSKGSATAFGVMLAVVLVLIGVACVYFSMFMGGENETKNAVDSGALNVGRKVVDDVYVKLNGGAEEYFRDVTVNNNGEVNLRNINRVWAKALSVAINADAAGPYAGNGSTAALQAYQTAKAISDRLAKKLNTQANLYPQFEEFAQQNSVRMLGVSTQVNAWRETQWDTSQMDRGDESNIELMELPPGYSIGQVPWTACKRDPIPAAAAGKKFLKGYTPITIGSLTFWQVPFQYDQKPHLVSKNIFDQGSKPVPQWAECVPNAFTVAGKTANGKAVNESAMSWVLSNPREMFPMQTPHGFVKIKLQPSTCRFTIFSTIPLGSPDYDFSSDSVGTSKVICGPDIFAAGNADVGNEFVPQDLYCAIFGPPNYQDSQDNVMGYVKQRCREMVPGCDVVAALKKCPINGDQNEQTFYLYPENGKLVAVPEGSQKLDNCDMSAPDGTAQKLSEWSDQGMLNSGTVDFYIWFLGYICITSLVPDAWHSVGVDTTIERTWIPGTGYSAGGYQGGCLGELTVHHKAEWSAPF